MEKNYPVFITVNCGNITFRYFYSVVYFIITLDNIMINYHVIDYLPCSERDIVICQYCCHLDQQTAKTDSIKE